MTALVTHASPFAAPRVQLFVLRLEVFIMKDPSHDISSVRFVFHVVRHS